MKSTPPDQNISNRMISILYDFCNFSSVYGHGWMAGWHRLLICVFTNVFHRNESSRIFFQLWFSLMRDNPRKRFQNFLQSGAFSIYKKFRKISIGNSGNFRLGRERSICHKSHSFTSPSPSLHQKTGCLGKLFCYFLERVFVRRFPVKQMLIFGMCGYEKSDFCMFPSF